MGTDQDVSAHYRHGSLEQSLVRALQAAGKDPDHLTPGDLMGADEFHVGGPQATQDLAAQLGLTPGMHLLDLGSGLGGPCAPPGRGAWLPGDRDRPVGRIRRRGRKPDAADGIGRAGGFSSGQRHRAAV